MRSRILLVGAVGGVYGGLRAVIGPQITISMLVEPALNPFEQLQYVAKPVNDDCFSGGRRSKGEKKRAARERWQRGGY